MAQLQQMSHLQETLDRNNLFVFTSFHGVFAANYRPLQHSAVWVARCLTVTHVPSGNTTLIHILSFSSAASFIFFVCIRISCVLLLMWATADLLPSLQYMSRCRTEGTCSKDERQLLYFHWRRYSHCKIFNIMELINVINNRLSIKILYVQCFFLFFIATVQTLKHNFYHLLVKVC